METVFVTAMYTGLSHTEHGGRNRDQMYLDSLKSLNGMHHKIICFVNPDNLLYHKWKVEELGLNYVTVLPFDIFSQDFSEDIVNIKNANPEIYKNGDDMWQHRCVQLMWSKTRMISTVIKLFGSTIDNVFWIDAGLSNSAIIRHKYFRNITDGEHYISTGLFIPRFAFNLATQADKNILAIIHTQPNNYQIPESYNQLPYGNNHAMIGGLFGGPADRMQEFGDIFEEYLLKILQRRELYSEESIYSGIFNDNAEMFNPIKFDTFYHKNWGDAYDTTQISFSSVIEKFIDTEIIHDK